ncbi:MAG: hypothetical protein QOJ16_762, partial [Acidobacteriota bacterium]|nr:hypothetical protein [Acidobacteriota bacterium]
RFDLRCGTLAKGFRVEGDFGRIEAIEASLDGQPLPPSRVRLGLDTPYPGGPIAPRALLAREWPGLSPAAGGLRLWVHDAASNVARREHDPETEKGLRALGYIQ